MDSLGGGALALVIACCSPAPGAAEESLSTLAYASRAKNIRICPVLQVPLPARKLLFYLRAGAEGPGGNNRYM